MGVDARMLVKTRAQVTHKLVRSWAYDLASAFRPDNFVITRPGGSFAPQHALEIVLVFTRDGLAIYPADGETFIEVNLRTRYYGKGYERGDLPTIVAVADWLERCIPECSIWYGGDTSGVRGEPFDKAQREELWSHFCMVGHAPYWRPSSCLRKDDVRIPICKLCQQPMGRMGWGPNWALFECFGCGLLLQSNDRGKTFTEYHHGGQHGTD